ncbi:hypothetical protein DINM_022974 [Dirofilaria immitis]|nr:hypothetical protein [Dirofilaria immitis]
MGISAREYCMHISAEERVAMVVFLGLLCEADSIRHRSTFLLFGLVSMKSNEPINKKDEDVEEVISQKDERMKNDSDDRKNKEKRRDSVTGSTLDTNSSSNSSVDSDEVDTMEHNDSKSTMTSEKSILQVDSYKIDDSINELMKISIISNMEVGEASKSVMEDIPSDQTDMFSNEGDLLYTIDKSAKRDTLEVLKDRVMRTCPKLGAWVAGKEMYIDGMETSNMLYMTDIGNRFAQRFTHWIRKFYIAAVDGNVEEFMIKFTCILQILKKSGGSEHYMRMSGHQLKEHVMNSVICAFFNKAENTSILHHLAPTKNTDYPCSMKNHGCCRLIKVILSMLPWRNRKILLATSTKRTGKTALHLAAATGQLCQMQALMDFEAWPDLFDYSGRAPIHYAIMRNNLEMVKLLLWYGADISLRERSATPLQLAGYSPTTALVRIIYVSPYMLCMIAYVNIYTHELLHWKNIYAVGQKVCEGVWTPRKVHINISGTRTANPQLKKCPLMLLFIIPTFYKGEDRMADASNPQIFCAKLQNIKGFVVRLLPTRPLLTCSKWSTGIRSALEKPHNDSYTLHLMVELEELRFQAPHITLAIQAFACGPPNVEHYNELRGLVTHSNNKTKVD